MENPVNIRETTTVTSTNPMPTGMPSTTTPHAKRKVPLQIVIGVALLLLLTIGGAVAFFLSTRTQDIRQQASGNPYGSCIQQGLIVCQNGESLVCVNGQLQDTGTTCSTSGCTGIQINCPATNTCLDPTACAAAEANKCTTPGGCPRFKAQ